MTAKGDIFRGYEVVEHAASFNSLAMGETVENVAKNVDIYSFRKPLGVCAGICPFNFDSIKSNLFSIISHNSLTFEKFWWKKSKLNIVSGKAK